MHEGYFVGRKDLINWIRQYFDAGFSKIEDLASGVVYCQIIDNIHPGSIPMGKVKMTAKTEVDSLHNFKVRTARPSLRASPSPNARASPSPEIGGGHGRSAGATERPRSRPPHPPARAETAAAAAQPWPPSPPSRPRRSCRPRLARRRLTASSRSTSSSSAPSSSTWSLCSS